MTRAVLLRLGAVVTTVLALLGSAGYVAAHPKSAVAPLQPPVSKPAASAGPTAPAGRIRIQPGVRATDLPAITGTHVS